MSNNIPEVRRYKFPCPAGCGNDAIHSLQYNQDTKMFDRQCQSCGCKWSEKPIQEAISEVVDNNDGRQLFNETRWR